MIKLFDFFYRKLLEQQTRGYDLLLLSATMLLVLVGTLMIYTSSTLVSDRLYGSSLALLRSHLVHLLIGMGALWVATRIPYRRWEQAMPYLLVLCFILLTLVLIPGVGYEANGARRWLRLGFLNFQPSELLKFTLILYVASYLNRKAEQLADFFRGLMPNMMVMGIFLTLVVMQPDFGTMVLIALTLLMMIFVGGAKPGHILFSLVGFAAIGAYMVASRTYRLKRFTAFLDPWQDRLDSGFQIVQSYLAFGSGGLWGSGLGDSRQKLLFLPDAHTDFIFSILAEELGLVGVLLTMALFALFLGRCFRVALKVQDDFGKHLAYGISTLFALQIVINMAVVMGLIPTKGLPLPFISYGGSALVTYMFMTGVLLSISREAGGVRGPHETPVDNPGLNPSAQSRGGSAGMGAGMAGSAVPPAGLGNRMGNGTLKPANAPERRY